MNKTVLGVAVVVLIVGGAAWYYLENISTPPSQESWALLDINLNSDLAFEMKDSYVVGESLGIVIRNSGNTEYRYLGAKNNVQVYKVSGNSYEGVVGDYTDNIVMIAGRDYTIQPNATTSIGSFPLVGCTSAEPGFACPSTRPLPPGKYLLVGQFPTEADYKNFTRIAKEIVITK